MEHLRLKNVDPIANPRAVVKGDKYRFTVLTDGLLRYEWAPDGIFEDRASTFAVRRALDIPDFRVVERGGDLEIITSRFHLVYNKKEFSPYGFTVQEREGVSHYHSVWRYGTDGIGKERFWLGGTARTLDGVDGRCELGSSIMSRRGWAVLDDSRSMLFESDGWVSGRRPGERVDGYIFVYGHDYRAAVRALYAVSGSVPLLPRWALGNWWSRYYPYTDTSYLNLMDRFRKEGLPFSVGVIDMHWHLVKGDERVTTSSGWTGYSWNPKLFPDPARFLDELHARNVKATLNVHPADGVQNYEDAYDAIAKALGRDTSTGDPIAFDITDPEFLNVYFNVLHRKLEDQGIDFWWIDWQQGEYSRIEGIDPLWMLNHFHFLDNARNDNRPITFSRYAGPGSHRYPVGFSGDTVISWASLEFQPEFTACASNVGYGWWSHDIGGHLRGIKDDELAARWVQLGVWSPILRLHSTLNLFNTKEPWNFGVEARLVMNDQLRLRHRLLPYLYTMNVRAARDGEPLVQPMYWHHSKNNEAYAVPNQFYFGSELVVAPITSPRARATRLGQVRAWLPVGRHVDIFSGAVYDGGRTLLLHRPLDGYPVLACEGAIIPLDADAEPKNGCPNPEAFEVIVVVGADGAFEILEDNGFGSDISLIKFTRTPIGFVQKTGTVRIGPALSEGKSVIPATRNWSVRFLAFSVSDNVRVTVGGSVRKAQVETAANGSIVHIGHVPAESEIVVDVGKDPKLDIINPKDRIFEIISGAQMPYNDKTSLWEIVISDTPFAVKATAVRASEVESDTVDAVVELLLGDSRLRP